jgi:hypothetical protein
MAICVAGGRHTKSSMLSDRLCVDLTTYMSEVVVDAETQTATAKGGATLGKRVHIFRSYCVRSVLACCDLTSRADVLVMLLLHLHDACDKLC